MTETKVLLWPSLAGAEIEARLREIHGAETVIVKNVEQLAAAVAEAEVLVIGGHFFSAHVAAVLRERAKRLRFVQTITAGYEGVQANGVPVGVVVANAGESWSPGVAEHGMALLLALTKRLPQYVVNKAQHTWDRSPAQQMGSLEGQTLVIVGFGSIGRDFARRAKAFGMRVIGVSRSARPDPAVDEVCSATKLDSMLARADAVLVVAPYSKATHHMIGAEQLAACKRGAVLINLARGGLIDQVALAAALHSGQLGGAALDVTSPEPLPADDPLWDCPNLIITPHVAGACGPVGRTRLAEFIGANVERFIAGQPVTHVVEL